MFAILDVKRGRKRLRKFVKDHKFKIPVTIEGFIVSEWSGDDGTSIEFEIDVKSHKLGKPVVQKCPCVRCASRKSKG